MRYNFDTRELNGQRVLVKAHIPADMAAVEIPPEVTIIGMHAFWACYNLQTIIIHDTVTKIGIAAFRECRRLQSIKIPKSVKVIGAYAFESCGLKSIHVPSGVKRIMPCTFKNCTLLESIVMPDTITKIGDDAFYHCIKIKSLEIPLSVTQIGNNAFRGCTDLEYVVVPDGLDIENTGINSEHTTVYRTSQIEPYLNLSRSMDDVVTAITAHNAANNQTPPIHLKHIQDLRTKRIKEKVSVYTSRVMNFARSFMELAGTCKNARNVYYEMMGHALRGLPREILSWMGALQLQEIVAQSRQFNAHQNNHDTVVSLSFQNSLSTTLRNKPSQRIFTIFADSLRETTPIIAARSNNRCCRCCLL